MVGKHIVRLELCPVYLLHHAVQFFLPVCPVVRQDQAFVNAAGDHIKSAVQPRTDYFDLVRVGNGDSACHPVAVGQYQKIGIRKVAVTGIFRTFLQNVAESAQSGPLFFQSVLPGVFFQLFLPDSPFFQMRKADLDVIPVFLRDGKLSELVGLI